MTEQNKLDSFDSYTGDWLIAQEVDKNKGYVCKNVGLDEEGKLVLTIENRGVSKKTSLNLTNVKKCMEFVKKPTELTGKIIYFYTVETQKGPGIRISDIVSPK